MAAGDAARNALVREVGYLDEDHGGSGAPTAAVRQLLLRSLPDVASLFAPHLAQLSPDGAAHVLDRLFASPPFSDRRMRRWTPCLRDHLGEYAKVLGRSGAIGSATVECNCGLASF